MGKTSKEFEGILKTPRTVTDWVVYGAFLRAEDDPEKLEEAHQLSQRFETETRQKIDALAEHFYVESPNVADPIAALSAYRELLLALATEFVPGFQGPPTKGRPSKWKFLPGLMLVLDMERHISPNDPTRGIDYAAAVCARKPYWAEFVESKDDAVKSSVADALKKAYLSRRVLTDFDQPFADMYRSLATEEWNEFVAWNIAKEIEKRRREK